MSLADALLDLDQLTRRLRRECPWDREQTALTIVPHTVEEAYEVADAAIAGDDSELESELGDLLFQAYFLSLLLEERGVGDLETVGPGCAREARSPPSARLRRCGGARGGRVRERWEAVKTENEGREGIFHDVPESLPALLQARKVQRRAATVGYDWPDLEGPLAKLREELDELVVEADRAGRPQPETEPDPAVFHELGDLLFTVVNVARGLNVDPELALRTTTRRFTARVERAAELAAEEGVDWSALELDAQDAYYERAKEALRK